MGTDASRCPSYRCAIDTELVGIVGGDGRVAFIAGSLRVDEEFVHIARQGRKPEARFRFAGPCHRTSCAQWDGDRCGLVERLVADPDRPRGTSARTCVVRNRCRWFAQRGGEACAVCAFLVTEDGTLPR
jgi:hypothetical protein